MVKIILIFIILLAHNSYAKEDYTVWNLKQKIKDINDSYENNFFIKIAIIESFKSNSEPIFANINNNELKSYGVFEQIDIDSLNLNINLNAYYSLDKKINFQSFINDIFDIASISILITCNFTNKDWYLFYKQHNILKYTAFNINNIRDEQKKINIPKLHNVLIQILGFNGIVLETTDKYALVTMNPEMLKNDAQAIVLNNSIQQTIINDKQKSADALLQLLKANQHLGIFEILVLSKGVHKINPGSKIIIKPN